jgi:hypothetical protein
MVFRSQGAETRPGGGKARIYKEKREKRAAAGIYV